MKARLTGAADVASAFRTLSFRLIESSLSARMKWPGKACSLHCSSRADDWLKVADRVWVEQGERLVSFFCHDRWSFLHFRQ